MKGETFTKAYDLYVVLNYKGSLSEETEEYYIHPLYVGGNWYISSGGSDFN